MLLPFFLRVESPTGRHPTGVCVRGGVSESDRLKPHGVPLRAWDERDPGTTVISTSRNIDAIYQSYKPHFRSPNDRKN